MSPSWKYTSSQYSIAEKIQIMLTEAKSLDRSSSQFKTLAKHFTEGIIHSMKTSNGNVNHGFQTPSGDNTSTELQAKIDAQATNLEIIMKDYQDTLTQIGDLKTELDTIKKQSISKEEKQSLEAQINWLKNRVKEYNRMNIEKDMMIRELMNCPITTESSDTAINPLNMS